ncbi:amino acid transporter [Calocera viscosa TUFC12733]|uniref:Amino acid transporter n=1 Tax=Calocera viscosa (strain TUFC12733) TaxID=1330018 RepID=A0A167INI8_CALVF|nr:amino acid transporter [Calocera viscosa TUFC12733]
MDKSSLEAAPAPGSASDRRLNELGYAQQFKRQMSFWAVVGMSFTAIGILTGMSSAFQTGLFSGGPLGLFWGWNICSIFMFLIALCLAEIASVWPTAGGLYYWVCKMKPDVPALGFITGNVYAWAMVLTGTSGNLSVALYLASVISIGTGKVWQQVEIAAMAWGVNILSGIMNTWGTRPIGMIAGLSVWWTLGGTVVLVICLLVKAPVKNTASFVFFDFENYTGWGSEGFVVLLGFLQAVYTLEGCETAAQVAEEAINAEWLCPIALSASVAGSWFIGVIYMLSLLFAVQSIASVQSTSYALPIAQLIYDAVGRNLSILLIVIILVAQWAAALTAWTASSRLFFALARDRAFPFQSSFVALSRTGAPYVGVWLSVFVGCVIAAAYIGSTIAFNGILAAAAIGVLLSYSVPIFCRVVWPNALDERGPFTLGRYSWTLNLLSLLFCIFTCVLFILPTSTPVTSLNMNYAIVAIGVIFMLVTIQYLGNVIT